jgi:hypothetical protein
VHADPLPVGDRPGGIHHTDDGVDRDEDVARFELGPRQVQDDAGPPFDGSTQLVDHPFRLLGLALPVLQKRHHIRIRADHVSDAKQRQPISDVTLCGADWVSVSAAFSGFCQCGRAFLSRERPMPPPM